MAERIKDRSTGFNAIDSYHRYKEDVQIMKKMGLNAYRFSIAWSRILPGGKLSGGVNKAGIEYYNNLINELVANGIEPFVTIFHWDVPQALEDEYGGFLSTNIILDFCDFAELCFWEFGDRVKNWITLNEPWSFCVGGYVVGNLPPGRGPSIPKHVKGPSISGHGQHRNVENYPYGRYSGWNMTFPIITKFNIDDKKNGDPGVEPYKVAHNQLLAHAAAVHLYKDNYQECQKGKIGITLVSEWMVPLGNNIIDTKAKLRALDFMLGWFLGPVTCGKYPQTMIDSVGDRLPSEDELKVVKGTYDFIGINYYTAKYTTIPSQKPKDNGNFNYFTDRDVEFTPERDGKPIGKKGATDWLYSYPEGIKDLLSYVKNNYCDPIIYITENVIIVDVLNFASTGSLYFGLIRFNTFTDQPLSQTCADDDRKEYHQEHLEYLKSAIE
ncbi:hypothetical protein LguiA_029504 [Lonicera macranthoides]